MSTAPNSPDEYAYHDRFRIPLTHPAALDFYLNELLVPHSRKEMIWAAAARAPAFAGRAALPALGLRYTQEGSGRAPADDADIRRICALLRDTGVMPDAEPSFISLADYGHSERGKVVVFVLDPRADKPRLVIKMSSQAEHVVALEREHATLCSLRERLGEGLLDTLPLPLTVVREGQETAFVQAYMPGRSMYLELRNSFAPRALVERHFRLARDWLIAFQQATRAGETRLGEFPSESGMAGLFADYRRIASPSAPEEEYIGRICRKARELENEPLPVVASQGDFWARNLILQGSRLGVIDWESYGERASPFADLFLFTTSYGLSYPWQLGRWAEPSAAFRSTYASNGWMARIVSRHLREFCARSRISSKLLEVCFAAFAAQRAIEEKTQHVSSSHIHEKQGARVTGAAQNDVSTKGQMWRRLFQECALMAGNACFG